MSFRLRPSSKRSTDTQHSLVQFPKQNQQAFISNEVMTLKQIINKLDMLESNLNAYNDNSRKDREISNAGYIEIQKRLDVLEYKSFSNEKDIKQIQDINRNSFTTLPPLREQSQNNLSRNQITVLKQTLLQERQTQKDQLKHVSAIMEQMSMKQLRLEQDLRESYNRTKQDYQLRIADQTDQIRKTDHLKARKLDQQYEMMKQNMASFERRIYEQLQAKMRKQTILKQFIQQKMRQVKQQMAQQQKQIMSTQSKLTRQTKQSLQSLFTMINQMKSTFSEQLTQTQSLSVNNIKRVSMNMDILSEKLGDRIRRIQQDSKENGNQIIQFRQWVVSKLDENREIVMGLEEDAIERMSNSRGGGHGNQSGHQSSLSPKMQQKFNLLQKDVNQWKAMTQQKNLTIFKEISQTLKHLKIDFKKQNDQSSSQLISLTESLKSIKKNLPTDMKKISQSIITIFNDQFDILAQELDLVTEMIKISKVQTEKNTKQEIKKHRQQFLDQIKTLINSSKKQMSLGMDKSLIKTEETQKKFLQKQSNYIQTKFNQKLQTLQKSQQDSEQKMKKINLNTNTQIQGFTLSMKQFNQNYKDYLEQQRKQDLKKRIELEQNMRKNASNLMDISYKKSQFLVQGMKNAIQMNYMKEKLANKQQFESIKDQMNRNSQNQKQHLQNALKQLKQKIAIERQQSQASLEQTINESISQNVNTLKRSLGIQIGNNKLQLQEKISESKQFLEGQVAMNSDQIKLINSTIDEMKRVQLEERQKMKKTQQQTILAGIHQLQLRIDENQKKINEQSSGQMAKNKESFEALEVRMAQAQKLITVQSQVQIAQIKEQITVIQAEIKRQSEQNAELKGQNEKLKGQTQKQKQQNQKLKSQKEKEQEQNQKNGMAQIQMMEEQTKRMQLLQEQLKRQVDNKIIQMGEKQDDSLKEMEETLTTLRESVWKMQAMGFSEQAKNKAMFDKITEDLDNVSLNLAVLGKQLGVQMADKKK